MSRIIDRIKSSLVSGQVANERLSILIIELRHRGINFQIQKVSEDGEEYFLAKSIDYPKGSIITSSKDLEELANNIKDAIFTAFDIPARYCNPEIINLSNLPLKAEQQMVYATT